MASSSNWWLLNWNRAKQNFWFTFRTTTFTGEKKNHTLKCLTDWSFFFAAFANSDKSRLLWTKYLNWLFYALTKRLTKTEVTAKATNILTGFLPIQCSIRKTRVWLYCRCLSWFIMKALQQTTQHGIVFCALQDLNLCNWSGKMTTAWSYYLSAICGMMKCCPFLWSITQQEYNTERLPYQT